MRKRTALRTFFSNQDRRNEREISPFVPRENIGWINQKPKG
jgi:hypothetical protein